MLPELTHASPHLHPQAPPSRPKPRYLGDGLDDEPSGDGLPSGIDDLFSNLDADLDGQLELPKPLDHAAIEATLAAKRVDPLDPFAISTGTNEPVKKTVQRRPNVKLDEERLLDPKYGIPKLISLALAFKPSGKGNEKEDLKRMLKMYRLWSHTMFPKGTFIDTIEAVEKLGHKRKMRSALKTWREERSGPKKKKKPDEAPKDGPSEEADPETRAPHDPSQTAEPSEPTAAPVDGPLFRPELEEDEFPDDDEELAGIFEKIEQVAAAPVSGSERPNVEKPLFVPEEDEEQYAEEEELLRQAENHERHAQTRAQAAAPDTVQPSVAENRPQTQTGTGDGGDENDEAHDWDDLYK